MKKILLIFLFIASSLFAQDEIKRHPIWKDAGGGVMTPKAQYNLNPFGNQLGNLGATGTRWNFGYLDTMITNHLSNTTWTLNSVAVTTTGTQLNYLNAATGTTGTTSSNLVFSNSPTLVTPVLGNASATSVKGNGIILGAGTSDASDNSYIGVSGGGDSGGSRGAYIYLSGNERTSFEGQLELGAGSGANPNNAIIKMTLNGQDVVQIINGRNFIWLSGLGASATDSSFVISHSLGSPTANWYGTDGDTWNIGINTNDGATFNGAATYNFDNQLIGKGTATNDNAAAGYLGEHILSNIASGSAVSLTTATTANVTSISLTAGDWDLNGQVSFTLTGATVTDMRWGYSTTSATLGVDETYNEMPVSYAGLTSTFKSNIPSGRISISATTTVYLVAQATFTVGTVSAYGFIRARRVR